MNAFMNGYMRRLLVRVMLPVAVLTPIACTPARAAKVDKNPILYRIDAGTLTVLSNKKTGCQQLGGEMRQLVFRSSTGELAHGCWYADPAREGYVFILFKDRRFEDELSNYFSVNQGEKL